MTIAAQDAPDRRQAINDARRALDDARGPARIAQAVALATLLREDGQVEQAVAVLDDALVEAPDSVLLLNHLGLARRAAADDAGTLRAFARAARLAPDDTWAATNMTFILLRRPLDRAATFAGLADDGRPAGDNDGRPAGDNDGRPAGLGLFCDRFPHTYGFLLQQFQTYLSHFPDCRVYSFGRSVFDPYHPDQFGQAMAGWGAAHPDLAGRVHQLLPQLDQPAQPGRARVARLRVAGGTFRRPRLAHNIFAMNADLFLPLYEEMGIPFTFTLNPGGGFRLDNRQSDANLRRVFASPWFRRVIVTYPLTRDYIRRRFDVPEDRITLIPGTIVLESLLARHARPRRRFGVDKDSLDICFGGLRYTPQGTDKGYDLFIAASRRLAGRFPHLRFHVFGDFGPELLPVDDLADRLTFHGRRDQAWLAGFHSDMDLILSPNRPHQIARGAFDGFPVTTCIEAAMCGTALAATDPMGLNFALTDGMDYLAITADAAAIVDTLTPWLADPDRLAELGRRGQETTRRVWGEAAQMGPRLDLFRHLLSQE